MLIIGVLILLREGIAGDNVAFGKNSSYCEDYRRGDSAIFDGDQIVSVVVEIRCAHYSFMDVYLGGKYPIISTVLYEGYRRNPLQENTMMTFVVLLTNKFEDVTHLCGQYPFYKPHNLAMTVNCNATNRKFAEVRLVSRRNFGLLLAEFEVYTLGSRKNAKISAVHRGCFKDFTSAIDKLNSNASDCFQFCEDNKLAIAAIRKVEGKENCYCSSNYNNAVEVSTIECGIGCDPGGSVCGSAHPRYLIYIVFVQLPHYIGCRAYNETSPPTETHNEMTITRCLQLCDSSAFAFLQDMRHCICSNISYDAPSFECSSACAGDDFQICGGQNCISMYQTCFRGNGYSVKCSRLFNCLGEFDEHGYCDGKCRLGYTGRHCIERVENADACTVNPCKNNSDCINIHDYRECSCIDGFYIDKLTEECIEIGAHPDYEATIFFLVFLALIIVVLFISYWQSSKNSRASQPIVTTFVLPFSNEPSDHDFKMLRKQKSKDIASTSDIRSIP